MGQSPGFGPELRALRAERGISLAGLAALTHYSRGYLSKIETGAKPASADLAQRLDDALDAGGHLVRLLAAADEPSCPYLGLAAFDTADAEWFFGRDPVIAELLASIEGALGNHRPVMLVGPSGVGKSSLLRAGLLPALAAGTLPGAEDWPVLVMTPTSSPGVEFSRQAQLLPETDAGRIVVVVDQFEEVFTLCESEQERQAFIAVLSGVAAAPQAVVVLGLRADFYDRCLSYPELLGALRRNQVTVGPMTVPQLRDAISRPAEAAGLKLEPGLVELLLSDAGAGGAGALPLLSHALLATWQEREDDTLTVAGYRRTGGIDNAVAETAERAYRSLDESERRAAQRLLLRLVRVGEHEQDTRRPAEREPLLRQQAGAEAAMQAFAAARLLTVDTTAVTITHEALLHAWPRLHGWIESDRSGLRVHQQLSEAAEGWDTEFRHPSLLYRGPRLVLATDWALEHETRLSALERDFLAASEHQDEQARKARRRSARRLRALVAGLAVLTVLAVIATTVAVRQTAAAGRQRDIAVSRALADEANQLRLTDSSLATQLSLAAYRIADTPDARGALLSSSGSTNVTRLTAYPATAPDPTVTDLVFTPDGRTLITSGKDGTTRLFDASGPGQPVPRGVLKGGAPEANALAVNSAGTVLATADEPDSTRLWHLAATGQPTAAGVLDGFGQALAVAFSHDGKLLALAGSDGDVRVWDVSNPDKPRLVTTLSGHTGAVRSLAFAPTAPLLITGGDDFTSRLWDLSNAEKPVLLATPSQHTATIRAVTFSPDGRTAATGSDDHSVEVWSVADPHRPVLKTELKGHVNAVWGIAYTPDGQTIATASDDQTVRLWNADDGAPLSASAQPEPARGAVFNPAGTVLATSNDIGEVWLWHLPPPFVAGDGQPVTVAYAPQLPQLAIADADGVVRLWDVTDPLRRRLAGSFTSGHDLVETLAYDPRGRVLAVGGDDRMTRLWDVADPAAPKLLATLAPAGDKVYSVAFSPDGHLLAAPGAGRTISLLDVTDPAKPLVTGVLAGHNNAITGLAFSPDGRLLASSSNDYSSRLWSVADPQAPTAVSRLADHHNAVSGIAFSPDGRLLATSAEDHTVHLLDVADPAKPMVVSVLSGDSTAVTAVTFSRSGHLLASAAADGTSHIWDVTSPAAPATLGVVTGGGGARNGLVFAPGGGTLATVGSDHATRLWETDPGTIAQGICQFTSPTLSAEQWSKYVTELPYRPLCP